MQTTMDGANILIVDDDLLVLKSLSELVRAMGYRVVSATSVSEARELVDEGVFQVILTDVSMPGEDGFELLEYSRRRYPEAPVVMITGYGSVKDAVKAIKMGAYDYITKPIMDGEVELVLARALEQRHLILENRALKQQLRDSFQFDKLVYCDPKMHEVVSTVKRVADTRSTVLITGESGTGKSLLARAIHFNSSRRDGPFVEVNCGSLPESLLESELFGHVKGAFSGAINSRDGKFKAADGGTVFLDEISNASHSLQTKLLRILEAFQFEPVGSNETAEVDVRVLLATNRDLGQLVRQGSFREDLYFRINVVNVLLPPLRERPDDIPLLAEYFLRRCTEAEGLEVSGFADDVSSVFSAYSWPGNVRELDNVIYRAVLLTRGPGITLTDLPERLVAEAGRSPREPVTSLDGLDGLLAGGGLKAAREAWERRAIAHVLKSVGGSRQKAAARLRVNRATLFNKMRRYDLQ